MCDISGLKGVIFRGFVFELVGVFSGEEVFEVDPRFVVVGFPSPFLQGLGEDTCVENGIVCDPDHLFFGVGFVRKRKDVCGFLYFVEDDLDGLGDVPWLRCRLVCCLEVIGVKLTICGVEGC